MPIDRYRPASRSVLIVLILVLVWMGSSGFQPGPVQIYADGYELAKNGQVYFAFMYYNELLRSYPRSVYQGRAMFAVGEYYFMISNLRDAKATFQDFLSTYPDSGLKLYALAYLLSMAQESGDETQTASLEKQIIDLQRVSFVFREKKEDVMRSPLYREHTAVIQIDKIEFFVEGNLFVTVSY